ncbi:MAG TPA: DUF4112 domain-containing protein [Thermoanaerobaculia bacterium]|nr:DUF4112 domain-containing protein [Thermoanaerobaculia bacterium]
MPQVHVPEVIEPDEKLPPDLVTLRRFADLMDRAVRIPGTKQTIGFDAAAGMIPGVGDVVTGAMSAWIIVTAIRHRVPLPKLFRMLFNLTIDIIIGSVPVVGDVFDVLHKQNVMNMRLLMESRNRRLPPRRGADMVAAAIVVLIVVMSIAIGGIAASVWLIFWLTQQRFG